LNAEKYLPGTVVRLIMAPMPMAIDTLPKYNGLRTRR
jgi:hypothetical protein